MGHFRYLQSKPLASEDDFGHQDMDYEYDILLLYINRYSAYNVLTIDFIRVFLYIHLIYINIVILNEKKTCNAGIQIELHKIYHA